MNFKDKRTRRICAASASAAVIVAGGVTVAQMASAAGSLSVSTSSFTTLDLGAAAGATARSAQTLSTAAPQTNTYNITFDGVTTATPLAAAATAQNVQDALNALSSIQAAGGVTVSGTPLSTAGGGSMTVTFNAPGARTALSAAATGGAVVITQGGSLGANTGGTLAAPLANATYAVKVATKPLGHLHLTLDSYTAPTGVTNSLAALLYSEQGSGAATGPTTGWMGLSGAGTTTATSANLTDTTAANDVFLTATAPGTYTAHFSDDNGTFGTSDDAVSPAITITVLDAETATASTTDDWAPTVSTSATSIPIGAPLTASVSYAPLTTSDVRLADSGGVGILAGKISKLIGAKFTTVDANLTTALTATYTNPGVSTAGATTATRTVPVGQASNLSADPATVTSTLLLDTDGDGSWTSGFSSLGTAQTQVTTNSVTGLTLGSAAVTGSVGALNTTAHTEKIKTGTASATFTATATAAGPVPAVSKVVYFTLTPGTNSPALTADGTLISSNSTTGVKIYSATTDATTGIASLTVSSGTTTATTGYSLSIYSNGVGNDANRTVAVSYENPAASLVALDNSTPLPELGATSVAVSGTLTDQFGQSFTPAAGAATQVELDVDYGHNGYVTKDTSAFGTISAGKFSMTYTPSASTAVGSIDTFQLVYNGTVLTDSASANSWLVNWTSATKPSTVTISAPADGAAGALKTAAGTVNGGVAVTGSVLDSGNAGLTNKGVTLSGSDGVYFATAATADATHPLAKTLSLVSGGSGVYGATASYVFFTKAGNATVTATSGSATKSITAKVPAATATTTGYKVTAADAAGVSGSILPVNGTVVDAFGNPVASAKVALSLDNVTLGALGSSTVTTDAAGKFTTTFSTAANTSGTAKLTATMYDPTNQANLLTSSTTLVPNAAWATAGLTIPQGSYQSTAMFTIGSGAPTLKAPVSSAPGSVTLTGTAPSGASVDIYAKKANSADSYGWIATVKADDTTGDWSKVVTLSQSTTYVAKVGAQSSAEMTVTALLPGKPHAKISLGVKAVGKGMVQVTVNGTPKKAAAVVVYVKVGTKWVKLVATKTNSAGHKVLVVKTGKGSKALRVSYSPAGAVATTVTISVHVK